jgi:hypothetical protein
MSKKPNALAIKAQALIEHLVENFESRITVPRARLHTIPRVGDIYWLHAYTRVEARTRTILRHAGEKPDPMLARIRVPYNGAGLTVRIQSKLRTVTDAATNREIDILRPGVCVDHTKFGAIATCADMQSAAIAGQVLARMINAGKL